MLPRFRRACVSLVAVGALLCSAPIASAGGRTITYCYYYVPANSAMAAGIAPAGTYTYYVAPASGAPTANAASAVWVLPLLNLGWNILQHQFGTQPQPQPQPTQPDPRPTLTSDKIIKPDEDIQNIQKTIDETYRMLGITPPASNSPPPTGNNGNSGNLPPLVPPPTTPPLNVPQPG